MKTQIIIIILRINRLTTNGEISDIGSLNKSATYSAINQMNLGNKYGNKFSNNSAISQKGISAVYLLPRLLCFTFTHEIKAHV